MIINKRQIMQQNSWVECRKCSTAIGKNTNYKFVSCACGAIAVDGGPNYVRLLGNTEYMIHHRLGTDGSITTNSNPREDAYE